MTTKIDLDVTDLNLTADAPAPKKKLTKGQQKILTYLIGLGPGPHKVPRPRMAAATGLADDTITRLASALATAGAIAVTGSGLETRTFEVLPAGATAMPQPEPVTSRVEKAMAKALATLPDYGQTVGSQVRYGQSQATADHAIRSRYGSLLVIESGPQTSPRDAQIDEAKRRYCQQRRIRIMFCRAVADVPAMVETVKRWLQYDPKAPHHGVEVMPDPRAVNDGRDWQHFHQTGEIRPYVPSPAFGPGTTYTELPLPADVVAEQARAKDDDEPAPGKASAPTPSEPVNAYEDGSWNGIGEPSDDQIARAEAADEIARAGAGVGFVRS